MTLDTSKKLTGKRRLRYLTAAVAALSAGSNAALAQQNLALEEVVVTAQKKAESLQDTPISLTAFGEEQLEKDGISNLNDIGSSVPSLTIEPFPINNATLRIFIRGVGLIDAQITQDPPVGVYIDGAYIARSTGLALDVADLQRIEVLRGPQGTLYGRNSTGGAINLITQRPDTEAFGFSEKITVGNRSLISSKTSVNVPVSDTAAFKLAYLHSEKDGFIDNDGPGEDFGNRDVDGYRLDFSWDIGDRLRLDYGYDKSELSYVNYAYQAVTPPTINPAPSSPAEAIQNQLATNNQGFYTFSDKRVSSMRTSQPLRASESEIEGHSLTLTYDLGESTQLKYIYAYRELTDAGYSDLTASGSPDYRIDNNDYRSRDGSLFIPGFDRIQEQDQSSHELQLSGSIGERVEYITGLYYFEEQAEEDNSPLHHQFSGTIAVIDNGTTTTKVFLTNLNDQFFTIDNSAWAVFGRATWTPPILEDRLHLTFGARHSEDEREATEMRAQDNLTETETRLNATGAVVATTPPTVAASSGWTQAASKDFADDSFEFIAEYDLTDDINVYGKFVEAYKSGGFNTRDPDQQRFARGFDEEKVESVELGVKSELLNRRLRINANVFSSDYTDIQLNFLIDGTIADTQVVNAGEAEMQGFEMDLTFLASRDLLLMLNYAYLDAEVTKATDPDTGADVTETFVFSAAPEHSYTAALDYTIATWDWGRLGLNVSYNYMDDRNGSNRTETAQRVFQEDYDLINARLGLYDLPLFGGVLNVAAWGKNLEDTEYVVNAVDNLPHADRAVIWGEPRSYGLDLIYNY